MISLRNVGLALVMCLAGAGCAVPSESGTETGTETDERLGTAASAWGWEDDCETTPTTRTPDQSFDMSTAASASIASPAPATFYDNTYCAQNYLVRYTRVPSTYRLYARWNAPTPTSFSACEASIVTFTPYFRFYVSGEWRWVKGADQVRYGTWGFVSTKLGMVERCTFDEASLDVTPSSGSPAVEVRVTAGAWEWDTRAAYTGIRNPVKVSVGYSR